MTYPEGEAGVSDLGQRHFVRALHDLDRVENPRADQNVAVVAQGDTPVLGLYWWHDCRAQAPSWHLVLPPADVLACPIAGCGERGRIVAGRWEDC